MHNTDTSITELGFQCANAIVEQIFDRLREDEENIAPVIPLGYKTAPTYTMQPPPPPFPLMQQHPNTIVPVDPNDAVLDAMMHNIHMIHNNMHQNFNQGRGRGHGRGTTQGRGRGDNCGRHQKINSYYHTHGNYAYLGSECNTQGVNHQNDATFTNMMGGSTQRCYWIIP